MSATWRSSRTTLLAAALTAVAVLVPVAALAAGGSPVAPVHSAGAAPCATSGLVVWIDTDGDGTAGSIYYELRLTNLSGHTCTVHGYPGVSAVSLTGHQLGAAARRDTTLAPHTVTLAQGSTAQALLRIEDVTALPTASCHPVLAAGLRVYPPGSTTSKIVPFPFEACSTGSEAYLTVSAAKKA